ncbi:MAG: calcium-binding protein [Pseudomonadota bacterium]
MFWVGTFNGQSFDLIGENPINGISGVKGYFGTSDITDGLNIAPPNVSGAPGVITFTDPGFLGQVRFFGTGLSVQNTPLQGLGTFPRLASGTVTGIEFYFNEDLARTLSNLATPGLTPAERQLLENQRATFTNPAFLGLNGPPDAVIALPNVSGAQIGQAVVASYNARSAVPLQQFFDQFQFAFTGTGANNSLFGTNNADILSGLGGDDLIRGAGGNDTLVGGTGRNQLEGGPGSDLYDLSLGVNIVGENVLDRTAIDIVTYEFAPTGAKIVIDSATFELGAGAALNDEILGVEGAIGTQFNDEIVGRVSPTADWDSLKGLAGDDTLRSGPGQDTLEGGIGFDFLDGGSGGGNIFNGEPIDLAVWQAAPGEVFFFLDQFNRLLVAAPGEGLDTVINVERFQFAGQVFAPNQLTLANANLVIGDGRSQPLNGTPGVDVVFGRGGNDFITTGGGADLAEGGLGNDMIMGGDGPDKLYGEQGNDTLNGNTGNDRLIGGPGNDALSGGGNADTLSGGDGNDVLRGGTQPDTLIGGLGNDTAFGGAGADTVDLGPGDDLFRDDTQNDRTGRDTVEGGSGDDTLLGNGGDDRLSGGDGNDVLEGGFFRDRLEGGPGNDHLNGGNQADTLFGGSGNDTAVGGTGADVVLLGPGDDLFLDLAQSGAAGSDTVRGEAGNDTLKGAGGNDVLDGGVNNDSIEGGAGNDLIRGGAQPDTLLGGSGNDTVFGDAGADTVDLGPGNDRFEDDAQGGANGADTVSGGAGNDTIIGGGGADRLSGGAINDTLVGGDGADAFVFEDPATGGTDRLVDFTPGVDSIALDTAGFTALSAGSFGAGLLRLGPSAQDANDFVLYDGGALFYDADANGPGAAVRFAVLNGAPALTADDFEPF